MHYIFKNLLNVQIPMIIFTVIQSPNVVICNPYVSITKSNCLDMEKHASSNKPTIVQSKIYIGAKSVSVLNWKPF